MVHRGLFILILLGPFKAGNGISVTVQKYSSFRCMTCACCLGLSFRDLAIGIETRACLFSTISKWRVEPSHLQPSVATILPSAKMWYSAGKTLLSVMKCPKGGFSLRLFLFCFLRVFFVVVVIFVLGGLGFFVLVGWFCLFVSFFFFVFSRQGISM